MSAWRTLTSEQQRAGMAAAALGLCLLLPWYRSSFPTRQGVQHDNLTAFESFSWVEAAVLLVAAAVAHLLWARAQRRGFHLPGGDGWAVTLAGGWVMFLLVWRLFDRPGVEQGSVGVQWGIFVTMGVAVALMLAGQRMRAEHAPEPPNPAEDETWEQPRRRHADQPERRPVDPAAVTQALRDRPPSWEGEPPEPPRRARPVDPDALTRRGPAEDDETRRLPADPPEGEGRLF